MFSGNTVVEAESLDWDTSFVWVADNSWLRRDPNQSFPERGLLTLKRDDGKMVNIDRAALDRDYICMEPGLAWKPKYRARKAASVSKSTRFRTPKGETITVAAGGALLRDENGDFIGVPPKVYDSCYEVVGKPGTGYPVAPFESRA